MVAFPVTLHHWREVIYVRTAKGKVQIIKRHSLPELLDRVGEVRDGDLAQVTNPAEGLFDRRVEVIVPAIEGVAVVGIDAGLRVPPVAARTPRQLCGGTGVREGQGGDEDRTGRTVGRGRRSEGKYWEQGNEL